MLLIFKTAIIRSYTAVYSAFAIQFAMFVVFSVFVSIGGELTPRTVFSTLLHISYLRYTTIHLLVGLVQVSEAFVGYKRIKVSWSTCMTCTHVTWYCSVVFYD